MIEIDYLGEPITAVIVPVGTRAWSYLGPDELGGLVAALSTGEYHNAFTGNGEKHVAIAYEVFWDKSKEVESYIKHLEKENESLKKELNERRMETINGNC